VLTFVVYAILDLVELSCYNGRGSGLIFNAGDNLRGFFNAAMRDEPTLTTISKYPFSELGDVPR
jgi:hypothetical protein